MSAACTPDNDELAASISEVVRFRGALLRAIDTWQLVGAYVWERIAAEIRVVFGRELSGQRMTAEPDLPRTFSEACNLFRNAFSDLAEFVHIPSGFPWVWCGGESLTFSGAFPNIDRCLASFKDVALDHWEDKVVKPFEAVAGGASSRLDEFNDELKKKIEQIAKRSAHPLEARYRLSKAIREVESPDLSRRQEQEKREQAVWQLLCRALEVIQSATASDEWAQRLAGQLTSLGIEISNQQWDDWCLGIAADDAGTLEVAELMLAGEKEQLARALRHLPELPNEWVRLFEWLKALHIGWRHVSAQGWLRWTLKQRFPTATAVKAEMRDPENLPDGTMSENAIMSVIDNESGTPELSRELIESYLTGKVKLTPEQECQIYGVDPAKVVEEKHPAALELENWARVTTVQGKFGAGWWEMSEACEAWNVSVEGNHNEWLPAIERCMRELFGNPILEPDVVGYLFREHVMSPVDSASLSLPDLANLLRHDCERRSNAKSNQVETKAPSSVGSNEASNKSTSSVDPSVKLRGILQQAAVTHKAKLEQQRREDEERRSIERFNRALTTVRDATPDLLAKRARERAEVEGDANELFLSRWANEFRLLGIEIKSIGLESQLDELEGLVRENGDDPAGHFTMNLIRLACEQRIDELEQILREAEGNPELHSMRMWLYQFADKLMDMRNRIWVEAMGGGASLMPERMAEDATHMYLLKVERLKELLVERANGGTPDEKEYSNLRRELVAIQAIRDALPEFVRRCTTIREFWNFVKDMFDTEKYRRRTEYLQQQFEPILSWLEGGAYPGKSESAPKTERNAGMIKVLLLSANPMDDPLGIDSEFRAIDAKIRSAEHRDHVQLHNHGAVHLEDVPGLLMRHKPHIVHFSGHGTPSGIELTTADGSSRVVPPDALADIFKALKDNVRVVLLNACDSAAQAEAIVSVIDCAVGMSDEIDDDAAVAFAAAFYEALGYGKSVQTAFDLALVQLTAAGEDRSLAKLHKRRGVRPSEVVLVAPASSR